MKRIILAGGSGFVGQALAPVLIAKGYEVVVLGRDAAHREGGVDYLQWDGTTLGEWFRAIDGADAIVNLTGKNVNCRHTSGNRREIIRSRVDSVRVLGEAIARCTTPPNVFVQASGIGYYGDTGDRVVDEDAPMGLTFQPKFAGNGKAHSICSTCLRRAKLCCASEWFSAARAGRSRSWRN